MSKAAGRNKIDTIFVLLIFCIFALSVLMVLMLGASIYKNMTQTVHEGQDERAVLSYIWTKAKNSDESGNVYTGDFHGISAMCFDEEYSGVRYQTIIYHYNGWVCELFSEYELIHDEESGFYPEDGTRLIKINNLKFEEYEHGLIKVSAGTQNLLISPRCSPVGDRSETIPGGEEAAG